MQRLLICFPIYWRDCPIACGEIVEVGEADEAAAEWAIRVGAARAWTGPEPEAAAEPVAAEAPPTAVLGPAAGTSATVGRRQRPAS
jgi:hypothetical protein